MNRCTVYGSNNQNSSRKDRYVVDECDGEIATRLLYTPNSYVTAGFEIMTTMKDSGSSTKAKSKDSNKGVGAQQK